MTKARKKRYQRKIKFSKAHKRTRWAPVWVVLKKLGAGKKRHQSSVTHVRRHWRRTKLKIKPRRQAKKQLG